MTIDRTPAHLSDMLAFVRELRAIVGDATLEAYRGQRVLNLAVETALASPLDKAGNA